MNNIDPLDRLASLEAAAKQSRSHRLTFDLEWEKLDRGAVLRALRAAKALCDCDILSQDLWDEFCDALADLSAKEQET